MVEKRRKLQQTDGAGPKPIASTMNSSRSDTPALRIAKAEWNEQAYQDGLKREEEQKAQERIQRIESLLKASGLPDRHRRHADRHGMRSACRPWSDALLAASRAVRAGRNVLLTGRRGTGKTQIAVFVGIDTAESALRSVRYLKIAEFFRECREAMSNQRESAALKAFCRLGLLIIDEAHVRGETDYEDRLIVEVVDRRYDAMRPTVLITNETREQAGKTLGASIVSRFNECGEVIDCDWESFRSSKSESEVNDG